MGINEDDPFRSHLLQMRGLKRYDALNMPEYLGSHLLQMRGLKPSPGNIAKKVLRSHLLQMRGLKHFNCTAQLPISVASFTDAWIETFIVGIRSDQ